MAKAEWGLKRICPNCGTRYYDMKKNPPICPNCGTAFDAEVLMRSRRSRAAAKVVEAKQAEDVIDELPIADADDAEDAVIEDAEELGDDPVEDVVAVEDEN